MRLLPENSDKFFFSNILLYLLASIPIVVAAALQKISYNKASDLCLLAQLWLIGNLIVGLWYYRLGPFGRKNG